MRGISIFLLTLAFVQGLEACFFTSESPAEIRRGRVIQDSPAKVKVDVYYEVLCPDSRHFIAKDLYSAWKEVGSIFKVNLKPYGKARHGNPDASGNIQFSCQHGPDECRGNMVHACVIDQLASRPSDDDLIEFMLCAMSGNYNAVQEAEKCAKEHSIDWAPVEACVTGHRGQELLAKYGDETHALRPSVTFIPTVVIDGSQKNQRSVLKAFKQEVCQAYKGDPPSSCNG